MDRPDRDHRDSGRDRDAADRREADGTEPAPDLDLRRWILRAGVRLMEMGEVGPLLEPLYDPWYRSCIQCGGALGRDGELYYVERALRSGEPLFEYAMCETCVLGLQDDLSHESRRKITDHWIEYFDVQGRRQRLYASRDPASLVDRCALYGRPREELDEFQIWAWAKGGRLAVDDYSPGILCPDAVEDIVGLLSRQTRDRLDDFVRDRLGVPPELESLPVLL